MDCDVLIAGAGPAGSVAATLLARAGLRVRLIDRARFPRPKLCGDTLNPGAYARLRQLDLAGDLDAVSLPVAGMIVTGEGGVFIEGRYPAGVVGRALMRSDLDARLVQRAADAGALVDEAVTVRAPVICGGRVGGLRVRGSQRGEISLRAPLTIAADGRRSTIAFALGLAQHPVKPRRWAIGAYYEGVAGLTAFGEMHIRRRHYLGIAPVPGGLANTCLVIEAPDARLQLRPHDALAGAIAQDDVLRSRFTHAQLVGEPVVLGPMAVDVSSAGLPGLLLAGDAAGFVDPMTGDGLRFAIVGAELAAASAIDALTKGRPRPQDDLAASRAAAFGRKYRLNRALRSLVASPRAVAAAGLAATIVPQAIGHLVRIAGDVPSVASAHTFSR
jgi:flavin-dependent dehydrogenase